MHSLYILICHLLIITCQGYESPTRSTKSKLLSIGFMDAKQPDRQTEDNFNALHDVDGSINYAVDSYGDSFDEADGHKFLDHRKKSDSRPKYDPGWKFIGLGKRPEIDGYLISPAFHESKERVNPFLGISTLINFEFINALRDGIEDETKETVKKESREDSGSFRENKMNAFGARQKAMYDPGWMLTGLGK